jgi:hypothetical protein
VCPTFRQGCTRHRQGSKPCSCGKTYIGQTRRGLKARIKEHIRDVKEDKYVTSAIAEHLHDSGHTVQFEKAKLLHHITDYSNRLHKEAIEIFKSNKFNFNRDTGWGVKNQWKPLLQQRTPDRSSKNSQVTPPGKVHPPPNRSRP